MALSNITVLFKIVVGVGLENGPTLEFQLFRGA